MNATPSTDGRDSKATFRQFALLVRAFFTSEGKRRAKLLLVAVFALAFAVAGVQVLMSYAGRDFFTAISNKDQAGYSHSCML